MKEWSRARLPARTPEAHTKKPGFLEKPGFYRLGNVLGTPTLDSLKEEGQRKRVKPVDPLHPARQNCPALFTTSFTAFDLHVRLSDASW